MMAHLSPLLSGFLLKKTNKNKKNNLVQLLIPSPIFISFDNNCSILRHFTLPYR